MNPGGRCGCEEGKPAGGCVQMYAAGEMPSIPPAGGNISQYIYVSIYEPASNGAYCPARPGRLSGLSVFHRKYSLYGVFVWVRRPVNSQKWRFPARAVVGELDKFVHVVSRARSFPAL